MDLLHAPEWLCQDDFFRIPIELSHLSASTGQRPQVEKRRLPTMTAAELYDLYRDMHTDHEDLCSWSSARAWKDWQTILGIRPPQEHSRCDDCAKYSKYRKLQDNEAELKAVVAAYNRHIKQVLADRHAMQSLEAAVEQAARSPTAPLPHLVILIDGMDRSKWLLPRELENSKKMSSLWRPSVHLVASSSPESLSTWLSWSRT